MKQVFIFSLPRSGSTLLQRILMAHDNIASIAEPWILLPQIYSFKNEGQISEYSSLLASKGINDLINNLPNKKKDYYESLRNFVDSIHNKLAINNEIYFLDKTPRYYLIIEEIREIFPEAKFIFLFRSPEQVFSSMINTWSNNRLTPFLGSYFDIIEGYDKLSEGYLRNRKQSISINYEKFVIDPENELKKVTDFLNLEFDSKMIHEFSKQDTNGSLGDPTGVSNYVSISEQGLNKWEQTFNTLVRKKIAISVIDKISEEGLHSQGYDKVKIINSLKSLSSRLTINDFRDIFDYYSNVLVRKYNMHLFFFKSFKWTRKKFIS